MEKCVFKTAKLCKELSVARNTVRNLQKGKQFFLKLPDGGNQNSQQQTVKYLKHNTILLEIS